MLELLRLARRWSKLTISGTPQLCAQQSNGEACTITRWTSGRGQEADVWII